MMAHSGKIRPSAHDEKLTAYHGTDFPYDIVKAGSWVTLSREEGIGYAQSKIIQMGSGCEPWLLTLNVATDAVQWQDGQGDKTYDGQHGTLLIDVPVTVKQNLIHGGDDYD